MQEIKEYVKNKKNEFKKYIFENNINYHLAIVQVGDNPVSNSYIKGKIKDCEEVDIWLENKIFCKGDYICY